MAVMLRTLGIPARVAVGYTQGTIVGTGDVRRVGTDDLHAWVEVRFPTFGWLPFEPTPGRANPAMASYAAGAGVPSGPGRDGACTRRIANDPDCLQPTEGPERPRPSEDPFAGDQQTGSGGNGRRFGLPAAIAAGLLAAAGLFGVAFPARRAWRRRRLVRRAGDEPRRLILASYDVFADRAAELGLPLGVGETPREYARRVVQDGRVGDGRVDRLATLTTRAAYALAEPSAEDALDAAADAQVVLQELAGATPLRQRVAGRLRLR
jgi:hypothetical protein